VSDHGETILPLSIGLVLAVVLTLTGLAWTEPALTLTRDDADDWLDRAERVKQLQADPVMEQRRRIRLGADAPVRPTIAWLGAQAYDDLMARRADTDQAPSQQEATPVEDAPMRTDASEPLPEPTQPTEQVAPNPEPKPQPQPAPAPPLPTVAPIPLADRDAPSPDALAALTPDDQPEPRDPVEAKPVEQEPPPEPQPEATPTPTPTPQPQPAVEPTPPPSPSTPPATPTDEESAPTSSPDENRESDAAQQRPDEPQKVRPGRVVVQQGIKIETAHPRFGIATLYSALPTDPLVRVVFSPQGQVIRAEIVESTGFSDVDGPILASLYKWKATGAELEKLNEPFDVEIRMRFGSD